MKYIKCFKNITEIGSGVIVDTPNVVYLKDKNLLYVPKSNNNVTIVNDGSDNIIVKKDGPGPGPEPITSTTTFNPANILEIISPAGTSNDNPKYMEVDDTYQIETNKDEDISNLNYVSSDNNVVTVTVIGVMEAVGPGNANITVTYNYNGTISSKDIYISVSYKPATPPEEEDEFIVTPENIEIMVGENATITANKPVSLYTSNDTEVVTVNDGGVITGIKDGSTTISVKHNDNGNIIEKIVAVKVNPAAPAPTPDDSGSSSSSTTTTTKIPETSGQTQTDNEETNESSGNTGQTDPVTESPTSTTSENPNGSSGNTEPGENPEVIDMDDEEHPL